MSPRDESYIPYTYPYIPLYTIYHTHTLICPYKVVQQVSLFSSEVMSCHELLSFVSRWSDLIIILFTLPRVHLWFYSTLRRFRRLFGNYIRRLIGRLFQWHVDASTLQPQYTGEQISTTGLPRHAMSMADCYGSNEAVYYDRLVSDKTTVWFQGSNDACLVRSTEPDGHVTVM